MIKIWVIILVSSFLFASCSERGNDRGYIMGDSVEQKESRQLIIPE